MKGLTRPRLSDLSGRKIDAVVTGGGVYGACFAYELASRGLKILLLEKNDFGAAASANSLRIVHGGLRYLQKFDLARARGSALERSTLLRIFPGLVTPLLCALPTGPGLKTGRLAFAGGLALNALITLDRNTGLSSQQKLRAGGLASREWLSTRCPDLDISRNSGAAFWYDAFMEDPDRLVFSYVCAAAAHGAVVMNHASVEEYLSRNGNLAGVAVSDQLSGEQSEVSAGLAIDCRSGWLAARQQFAAAFREERKVRYARGINLIVGRELCACATGFVSGLHKGKKRFLFMVPYQGKTMIGTWYLPLNASPESTSTTGEERAMMLREVIEAMPAADLSVDDIVAQHVGILPCEHQARTYDDEPQPVEVAHVVSGPDIGQPKGLWLVQGEKWTTARKTAESASKMIADASGIALGRSCSAFTPLSHEDRTLPEAWRQSAQQDNDVLERLWRRRGKRAMEFVDSDALTDQESPVHLYQAEARFAVEQEMALSLGDIVRRLGIGQLECPSRATLVSLANAVRREMAWSESEVHEQVDLVMENPRYSPRKISHQQSVHEAS